MADGDNVGIQIIEGAIKLPGMRVNRREFLSKTFSDVSSEKLHMIMEEGPQAVFSTEELEKIADKVIRKNTEKSTTASVMAGLPSNPLVMAGTFTADMVQYYGFALRMAQQLGYLYGVSDLLSDEGNLTEEGRQTLQLYLAAMLGISGGKAGIMFVARGFGTHAGKQIIAKPLTKTMWYPLIKTIGKQIGIQVTKKGTSKLVSKAVPILGGVISGGITYVSMKPMGKRLMRALADSVNPTEKDINEATEIIEGIVAE